MTGAGLTWRLILDHPQDGFRNMAVDEALLENCRQGAAPPGSYPVLRLYGWSVPTLSLGRFQDALRAVDHGFCRERGIPVVRRPTGGAAVLHDLEVTYSLVGPTGQAPFGGSVLDSYREIAAGVARGLSLLGLNPDPSSPVSTSLRRGRPAQCFASAANYEVTFGGQKLVGSAQVRRRGAALQHGSILLDANARLFDEVTGGQRGRQRGWTTLRDLLGRRPGFEEVAVAMARGVGEVFGIRWFQGDATVGEDRLATHLRAQKYLNTHWTSHGSSALSRF